METLQQEIRTTTPTTLTVAYGAAANRLHRHRKGRIPMRHLLAAIMAMFLLTAAPGAFGQGDPLDVFRAYEYSGEATCYARAAIAVSENSTNRLLIAKWTVLNKRAEQNVEDNRSWWDFYARNAMKDWVVGYWRCTEKTLEEFQPDLSSSQRYDLIVRNLRRAKFSLERADDFANRAIGADAAEERVAKQVNEARIAVDEAVEKTEKQVSMKSIIWLECSYNLQTPEVKPKCNMRCVERDFSGNYNDEGAAITMRNEAVGAHFSCGQSCLEGATSEAIQCAEQHGSEEPSCHREFFEKQIGCAKRCHQKFCQP